MGHEYLVKHGNISKSVQSTALPPQMDGSIVFASWHQCAYLSNTGFLGPTRVHILNGFLFCSATFVQLTAEGPILFNGTPLQNCPLM